MPKPHIDVKIKKIKKFKRIKSLTPVHHFNRARNLQLVTAVDFNVKLRERGVDRLTVQAVCKVAMDEVQVRETLDVLWKDPRRAGEIMRELRAENEDLYMFEELLESGGEFPARAGCLKGLNLRFT